MSVDSTDPYALKAHLGTNIVDNAVMASRWPPGSRVAVHPSGYYNLYPTGGPIDRMAEQLPEPRQELKFAFNASAPNTTPEPVAPITPTFDQKFNV